jgi:hypothetical protein
MFSPQHILSILVDDAFVFGLIYDGQGIVCPAIFGYKYIGFSQWQVNVTTCPSCISLWTPRFASATFISKLLTLADNDSSAGALVSDC